MQNKYLYLLIPFILLVLFFVFLFKTKPSNNSSYEKVRIEVGNVTVNADVADTNPKRELGLSGRRELKEGQGMIFIFNETPEPRVFWMKDMLISIDIIWINGGKVLKIDKNLLPPEPNTPVSNLTQYASPGIVEYVLEVPAGFSEKSGIKIGDEVKIPS